MKKLYFLLVLTFIFSNYGYTQATYDIVIAYERQPTPEKATEFSNSISIEELNIKYEEPEPIIFEIVEANNPKCADDAIEVSIDVFGGTGSYLFYVDGTEQKNPKPTKEADGYYHIRGLIPTEVNSIKVTDENGSIEK